MTPEDRALLAHEVYEKVLNHTETFYDEGLHGEEVGEHIGGDLAYLLGAILDPDGNGAVDYGDDWLDEGQTTEEKWPILPILRRCFPPEHPVWRHIVCDAIN